MRERRILLRMAHPLDSCLAKLIRANQHIGALKQSMRAFFKRDPYRITVESDPKAGAWALRGWVDVDPPLTRWGCMIGDVANNLRSALDNLVWELAMQHLRATNPKSVRAPLPRKHPWSRMRFPIMVAKSHWKANHKLNLFGVDPRLYARFKALQPFDTWKHAPKEAPLAILEEIWNLDKHRSLPLTQAVVRIERIDSTLPEAFAAAGIEWPTEWVHEFNIGAQTGPIPFENGTVLTHFREGGTVIIAGAPLYVNPIGSFEIQFDKGSPADGANVIAMLEAMREDVRFVVREFKAEFP